MIDLRGEIPLEDLSLGSPGQMPESVVERAKRFLMRELGHSAAFLFPLRLFIGIGWLRAFAEKVIAPGWFDGGAVGAFLDSQVASDAVVFPLYGEMIESILRPGSRWIGWVVMALQLVVGLGILFGTFTNLALLIGIVLNANFMLAGEVAPSAFYIVIQTVLFVTGAGAILGADGKRARRPGKAPSILLVAQPDMGHASNRDKTAVIGLAVLAVAQSWFGFAYVTDLTPTGIFDPALVFGTVMGLGALSLLILRFQFSDLGEATGVDGLGQ